MFAPVKGAGTKFRTLVPCAPNSISVSYLTSKYEDKYLSLESKVVKHRTVRFGSSNPTVTPLSPEWRLNGNRDMLVFIACNTVSLNFRGGKV